MFSIGDKKIRLTSADPCTVTNSESKDDSKNIRLTCGLYYKTIIIVNDNHK